jgi:nicotinate dehydrogenase subunit B
MSLTRDPLPVQQSALPALPKHLDTNPTLSRWVQVREDGFLELRVGKVEFGQGILTALAQVAADELDVPLETVRMLGANTATGPDQGLTAGSMSVFDSGPALRVVCASVRALFLAEAARRWGVDSARVSVEEGRITGPGGLCTSYGELAAAVDLDVVADACARTKDLVDLRVVGESAARLDLPDKVAGVPAFLQDLRLPDQLFGRVVRPPSPGARLVDPHESAVSGLPVRLVRDGSFLGVVGAP